MRKRRRLRQVERWLRDHFPTPMPVDVCHVEELADGRVEYDGITETDAGRLRILIDVRNPTRHCVATLIHEWAHAVDWRHARLDDHRPIHGPTWGVEYAHIYTMFYDEDGDEDSKLAKVEDDR